MRAEEDLLLLFLLLLLPPLFRNKRGIVSAAVGTAAVWSRGGSKAGRHVVGTLWLATPFVSTRRSMDSTAAAAEVGRSLRRRRCCVRRCCRVERKVYCAATSAPATIALMQKRLIADSVGIVMCGHVAAWDRGDGNRRKRLLLRLLMQMG